jgi:tetratricopeptide (TPR) repeat protein
MIGVADTRPDDADEVSETAGIAFSDFEDNPDPHDAHERPLVALVELVASSSAAQDRRDWGAALAGWSAVRERFPEECGAYTGGALALRELGRLEEAHALLRVAAQRFPDTAVVFHDLGRVAERRDDWAEAECCWRRFIELDPAPWWGYANLAHALNRLDRAAEADGVMSAALERQPKEFGLLLEHARQAEMRGEWDTALARWQIVQGWSSEVRAGRERCIMRLCEQGRAGAAEALLRTAVEQFPGEIGLQQDLARLAEARADWAQAERCWRRFLAADVDQWWAYAGLARALSHQQQRIEAEAVLASAQRRLPQELELFADSARLAERAGEWNEALARWQAVRERFPQEWIGYERSAACLGQLDRLVEAEGVLNDAAVIFPDHLGRLHNLAQLAERRLDWSEAERHWRHFLSIDQSPCWAHTGLAGALRAQDKFDDAEAVLAAVQECFPREPLVLAARGQLAAARCDWVEAEKWWREFLSIDANTWWAHASLARALRQQERAAEAEAVLAAAQDRLPGEVGVFADHAELAEYEQRWSDAARRWAVVRERWPDHLRSYLGLGLALAKIESFDQADKVLEEAMKRFPAEHLPVAVFAEIADLRHDWPQAVLRWTHARMLFPQIEEFGHRLFEARLRLHDADPGDDRAHNDVVPAMTQDRQRMYDVMMCFEGLGHGCEFGTVQRTYGAEPLGLLRWASIPPQGVVAALDSNFAGIGTVEQTELFTFQKEYIVRDRIFDMATHTFVLEDKVTYDKMFYQTCRRLKYLSEKLLSDIKSGEKIFVYFYPFLKNEEISALFSAIRRHGEATLFVVQVATVDHPPCTVEVLKPGLIMGYVPNAGLVPGGGAHEIPIEAWGQICRAALEQVRRPTVDPAR